MKILFSREGKSCYVADKERIIFCIDNAYFDVNGNEVPDEASFHKDSNGDSDWYHDWMDYEGLPEPLSSASTVEPEYEIDDVFGNFGFKNKDGEFVIEPQYAYAHEFTNGLASVNLSRTWYKTPDGQRHYENHYGYIDGNGKTVIGFQYDNAYPFNKYGVAAVTKTPEDHYHLIDLAGNEIPDTDFPYISYYDYNDRYFVFSLDPDGESLIGLYDTKERKILIEPKFSDVSVIDDDHILISESDCRQYYVNENGELLYPWLSKQRFAVIEKPDINDVAAVAVYQYTRSTDKLKRYLSKGDEKKLVYGLYSSKEEFLLPQEYDAIRKLHDNVWACYKNGILTVVETEPFDSL